MAFYLFPLYVHYELRFFQYFKSAMIIAIYQPIRTIYLVAAIYTVGYLYYVLPSLLIFFGLTLPAFVTMYITYRTFIRIEQRQQATGPG